MIKPLNNNVLIKLEQKKEKSDSGIILPENEKNKENLLKGTIEEIGSNIEILKIGDKVLFSKYGANEIDKDYLIVSLEDILAII